VLSQSNARHPGILDKAKNSVRELNELGNSCALLICPNDEDKAIRWLLTLPSEIFSFDCILLRGVLFSPSWRKIGRHLPIFTERHIFRHQVESKKDNVRKFWEDWVSDPSDWSSGFLYVTEEMKLADNLPLPSISLGNPVPVLPPANFNCRIRGRVGISANQFSPALGLDRFFQLAKLNSNLEFRVASSNKAFLDGVPRLKNVFPVLCPTKESYQEELLSWTLGIGPLAIERKGLTEAAPLKVRDYVGVEMPVLVNFTDTNFSLDSDPAFYSACEHLFNPDSKCLNSLVSKSHLMTIDRSTILNNSSYNFEKKKINFIEKVLTDF
jgi:hypothetical protein